MSEPHEIITEIDKLTRQFSEGDFWKRIRIAVSPEEEEALKEFIFKYENARQCEPVYFSRILGVPIQVESDPTAPQLLAEFSK